VARARVLDGARVASEIREEVAADVQKLKEKGVHPKLAVVLMGDDPASAVYVRMKARAAEAAGIESRTLRLPARTSQDELFGVIDGLNADPAVHGILVQLPLPSHIRSKAVLERIRPSKDVDGFHPLNVGRAFVGDYVRGFRPATPAGIMELFARAEVETHGKHAVIVGRSLIVGKPMASLLIAPGTNATATLAHKYTVNLTALTRMADILVVAVGKPSLITADMVKPGATVIDVGINRVPDDSDPRGYRIVGDVDFEGVSEVADAITPVPGGVGPMTIAMLLQNTLQAARRAAERAGRRASGAVA